MTRILRRSAERGGADHGWLQTQHSFSFADYMDPRWMGFRPLRVLNEDVVAPGMGFGMHGHRDMEIVTVVRSGRLAHNDSLGHRATIQPGEIQRITAGTGIRHSEMNPSATEPVHLYQIWLMPERTGLQPGYEQKTFDPAQRRNRRQRIVSPDGAEGSLRWHQDANLHLLDLEAGKSLPLERRTDRYVWLQVMAGTVNVDGLTLATGDGLALGPGEPLLLETASGVELMAFDLP